VGRQRAPQPVEPVGKSTRLGARAFFPQQEKRRGSEALGLANIPPGKLDSALDRFSGTISPPAPQSPRTTRPEPCFSPGLGGIRTAAKNRYASFKVSGCPSCECVACCSFSPSPWRSLPAARAGRERPPAGRGPHLHHRRACRSPRTLRLSQAAGLPLSTGPRRTQALAPPLVRGQEAWRLRAVSPPARSPRAVDTL
jgi:hypothetical protein